MVEYIEQEPPPPSTSRIHPFVSPTRRPTLCLLFPVSLWRSRIELDYLVPRLAGLALHTWAVPLNPFRRRGFGLSGDKRQTVNDGDCLLHWDSVSGVAAGLGKLNQAAWERTKEKDLRKEGLKERTWERTWKDLRKDLRKVFLLGETKVYRLLVESCLAMS